MPIMSSMISSLCFHIDDVAITGFLFNHFVPSIADLIHRNYADLRSDFVKNAEINKLLRFADAADR